MGRYMIPVCAICGKRGKYFNDRDSFVSIDICNECYSLYEKLYEKLIKLKELLNKK